MEKTEIEWVVLGWERVSGSWEWQRSMVNLRSGRRVTLARVEGLTLATTTDKSLGVLVGWEVDRWWRSLPEERMQARGVTNGDDIGQAQERAKSAADVTIRELCSEVGSKLAEQRVWWVGPWEHESGAFLMGTQEGWVLATPCDQTIAYITEDGSTTLLPSEAKVFTSEAEAEAARDEDFLVAVTHVPNVAHFRMGAPTWMDRPASMASLFALARTIMDLLGNENLRSEKFEVRAEAYLLQCAAEVFLKALGHKDKDGAWVFGKSPGPTAGEVS